MKKFFTFSVVALLGLSASVNAAESQTLAEGEYIIKNASTGLYFGGGLTWGTRATNLNRPQFFGVAHSDGKYTLDSHQHNNATSHFFESGLFVDGASTPWIIAPTASGNYTISDGTKFVTGAALNTTIDLAEQSEASEWIFISKADIIASQEKATMDTPVDVTAFIKNPELKRNGNTSFYPTWTVTGYDGTGTPGNYSEGQGENNANCSESWHSKNGFKFEQTISDLKAGVYGVSAQAFYEGTDTKLPYLYANGEKTYFNLKSGSENSMITAYASFLAGNYQLDTIKVKVTDGNLTIGLAGESTALWNIFGQLSLTYYGADLSILQTSFEVKWNTADSLATKEPVMQGAVLNALKDTVSAYADVTEETKKPKVFSTVAAYNAAIAAVDAAITNANNSATAYANTLTALNTYNDKAASLDEAGQAACGKAIASISKAYDDKTMEGDKSADVKAAYLVGVKAQTTDNSDMTDAVANAKGDAAVDEANWKLENALASGEKFHLDTWAGNAAGMQVPMIEFWIDASGNLANNVIYQNIEGLHAGVYEVSAEIAVNKENSKAPVGGTATLFANEASVDITTGGTTTGHGGNTGVNTVQATLAEDGNLKIGFVVKDAAYNWLAFKNVKLTLVSSEVTAIQQVAAKSVKSGKMIQNGKLVIVSNGRQYNAAGVVIK